MTKSIGCLIGLLWFVGGAALAGDTAQAQPTADAQIPALIKQLDDDQFGTRQTAAAKLATVGKQAVPALKTAALGESLEVTYRAVEILHKLHQSSDAATNEAAKRALEELAKSDHPSAASRAAAALKPKPDPRDNAAPPPVFLPAGAGPIIVQGINVPVGAGVVKRVASRTINGTREIEVEENSRKIKIVQDPAGAIKMELTEERNGKSVTDKFEAKNGDELKKKHPQAHAIYQQYVNNPAGGQVQLQVQLAVGGNAMPMPVPLQPQGAPAVPGQPIPPPIVPGQPWLPVQQVQANRAEHAASVLKGWSLVLPSLAGKAEIQAASKETREKLKKQAADLKQQLAELEKSLSDAEKK